MGCDIHIRAEKHVDGKWAIIDFVPFDWRSYSMFAFLAGVRNYSGITPIAEPRGLPDDAPALYLGDHSFSWLSIEELTKFDYDQVMEDRRVTRQIAPNRFSGAETCEPGEGRKITWRKFLDEGFFHDLDKLKELGAERIVFGFDSSWGDSK